MNILLRRCGQRWALLASPVPRPPLAVTHLAQRGLSLIELMVALVISMLILIGLVQIFVSSRATYDIDEGLARLQENGRFAVDFITRDLRMAGDMGCFNLSSIQPKDYEKKIFNQLNGGLVPFAFTRGAVEGFEYNGTNPGDALALPSLYPLTLTANTTPPLDGLLVGAAAPGSDVLVLRGMDTETVPLITYQPDELVLAESSIFREDGVYLIADCSGASAFQATTVATSGGFTTLRHDTGGTSLNVCSQWGDPSCKTPPVSYQPTTTRIARFNTVAYYIGPGAGGGPALIRRSWAEGIPADVEIVDGVENMQLLFGFDMNQDMDPNDEPWYQTDMYLPANRLPIDAATGLPRWRSVTSVRINLLVSGRPSGSTTGLSDTDIDRSTYGVGGVTIDPVDDKRQRRVFTTTINLRNR